MSRQQVRAHLYYGKTWRYRHGSHGEICHVTYCGDTAAWLWRLLYHRLREVGTARDAVPLVSYSSGHMYMRMKAVGSTLHEGHAPLVCTFGEDRHHIWYTGSWFSLFVLFRRFLYFLQYFPLFSVKMPPKLFTVDGEKFLMEQFEKIWVQSSGSTLKAAEKYELVAQRVNDAGKKEGWLPVTAKIVDNKIDSLRKKGRKVYNAFRKATRTGAPCPDDFDLEVREVCLR